MGIAGTKPPIRATRQRAAVAAVLDEVEDFRSAQELHELLRRRGERIGLTTVYRALQMLADAQEVDVLSTADGGGRRTCRGAVGGQGGRGERLRLRYPHSGDLRYLPSFLPGAVPILGLG